MPTLRELRRALARSPGLGLEVVKTGVETSAGVYEGLAVGTDAQRTVVTSDLVRSPVSGSTDTDTRDDYRDADWIYDPTSVPPEQRQIANQGYDSSASASTITSLGSASAAKVARLTASRNFSRVIPAATELEIHGRMPVLDERGDAGMMTGMHRIINRALRAMPMRSRLTLSGNATDRLSLATYPWLFEAEQMIGLYDAATTASFEELPLYGGGTLRFENESPYLVLGSAVASGRAFYLDVWRPRSSWVKVGATWAASTVGLVNETDECVGDEDRIALVAYYFACDELSQNDPRGEVASWAKRRDRAAEQAMPYMRWLNSRMTLGRRRLTAGVGGPFPRRSRAGGYHGGQVAWP